MAIIVSMRAGASPIRVDETLEEITDPSYIRRDSTLLHLTRNGDGVKIVIPWNSIAWIQED